MSQTPMVGEMEGVRPGWSEAVRDVLSGLVVTVRASLMIAGAAALVALGALVSSPSVREALVRVLPDFLPINAAVAAVTVIKEREAASTDAVEEGDDDDIAISSDPKQRAVTRYLSKRYRVAHDAVGQVVAAAFVAGQASHVDPLLVLAVVAIESSMNPFAESAVGAQGLMQVMTHVHTEKFAVHGGDSAALDPVANVKVGSEILADLIRRGGSVERGLQLYVGAGKLGDDGGYSARVLAEHAKLKQIVTGGVAGIGKVPGATNEVLQSTSITSPPGGGGAAKGGAASPPDSSRSVRADAPTTTLPGRAAG